MTEWGPALAVILGIVEGLTEFLPVSSTGHLILVGHALGFTGDAAANAEISIQLGAILAVIVFERDKIGRLLTGAWQEQAALQTLRAAGKYATYTGLIRASMKAHPHLWFVAGLGLAFLPAAAVGFLAHGWIKSVLFTPQTVAATSIMDYFLARGMEAWPGGRSRKLFLGASLGYGTYEWTLSTRVDDLNTEAVLGLFTYQDDTHEIDVEPPRLAAAVLCLRRS